MFSGLSLEHSSTVRAFWMLKVSSSKKYSFTHGQYSLACAISWATASLERLRQKQQAVEAATPRVFPRLMIGRDVPRVYDRLRKASVDVKFLERIALSKKRLYQFTAIDDCTRIRVLKIFDVCNQKSAISFVDEVIRRLPFRVLVIQTDNGAEFQSNFHWHLEEHDIRHVYIRPRTPRLNGKVERSHRVDEQEFYQLLDRDGISDDIHLFNDKLREWEDYYNYHRPHGALDGQTPYERLLAKTPSARVLPKS